AGLDDEGVPGKIEILNHRRGIFAEMLDQADGYRRAIGVVPKQYLGIDHVEVLQVPAIQAEINVQWVDAAICLMGEFLRDESVADRRRQNGHHELEFRRAAQATAASMDQVLRFLHRHARLPPYGAKSTSAELQ